jgi:hypothetical protein
MTYWLIGDEECNNPNLLSRPGAAGLYYLAGSFVFQRARNEPVPRAWIVPPWFVGSVKGGRSHANYLVQIGLWKQVDGGGYEIVSMQRGNTPERMAEKRRADREKPSKQARGRPD